MGLNQQQITLLAGGLALAMGLMLLYYYYRAKHMSEEMWAVDTYPSDELRRMCSGGFDAVVEVQGRVSCDQPVVSPAAGLECCWCRTRVESEQTKVSYRRGERITRTEWETEYDKTLSAVFKVHDDKGYTLVNPMNSMIDSEEPFRIVTEDRSPWFENVGFSDTGRYRVTEEFFLPGGYAYVLGQASTCGDGTSSDVLIHYPEHGYTDPGKKFFLISRKSEKDLTAEQGISMKVCFWGSVVAFLLTGYCILILLGVA